MGANRFRGELSIECDDVAYILCMDMNTLAAFETETGKDALVWAEDAEAGQAKVGDLITMIHCTLQRHHPDAGKIVAGDILSEDPRIFADLFQAASPGAADLDDAEPDQGK